MSDAVTVLALCESRALVLQPNRLYRFEVVEGCAECKRLASENETEEVEGER